MEESNRFPWASCGPRNRPLRPSLPIARLMLMVGLILCLVSPNLRGQATGIVIYKDNTSMPDGSAKVVEYTSVRRVGEVTTYFTPAGKKFSLTKFQPQKRVSYPNLLAQPILNPSMLGGIENGVNSYRVIVKTYPRSSPFLRPYIENAEEIMRRIRGGEVLFNGSFMTLSEYEEMVEREERASSEFLKKSKEKKRREDEQSKKLALENRRRKG